MYTQKIALIFDRIQKTIWRCINQKPFILFIHHIWGETVLFNIQTWDRIRYFTIFQAEKLNSDNIQDDQSWAFSETVQKISKIGHNHLYGLALCCCRLDLDYNTIVWNTKFYHPTNFGIKRIKTQCKSSSFASIKWPKSRENWSGCGRLGVSAVLSRTAVDSDWCFNNLVVVIITN